MKVLVINPGATSTKVAVFEEEQELLKKSIVHTAQELEGFDRVDDLLTGVETRSSSPLRVVRDENMETSVRGVIPAGEGPGYAGGIMSAAVEGIKAAEAVIRRHLR